MFSVVRQLSQIQTYITLERKQAGDAAKSWGLQDDQRPISGTAKLQTEQIGLSIAKYMTYRFPLIF